MSKKISLTQLIIIIVVITLLISNGIINNGWNIYYGSSLSIVIIWILSITVMVLGIIQIVFGAKENMGISIAAGITGIIGAIIWPVLIAALILNIIIVSRK